MRGNSSPMPCDACGCACGEAPEEADVEVEAPLLDSASAPGGHIAAPRSTGISISWEALRSPFVSANFEEESVKLTRCLFRALSILLWLVVVDIFRRYPHHENMYLVAIMMAFGICMMWSMVTGTD